MHRPKSAHGVGEVLAQLQLEGSGAKGTVVNEEQHFWQVVPQEIRGEGNHLKIVSVNDPLPPSMCGTTMLEVVLQGAPTVPYGAQGRVLVRVDHTQECL